MCIFFPILQSNMATWHILMLTAKYYYGKRTRSVCHTLTMSWGPQISNLVQTRSIFWHYMRPKTVFCNWLINFLNNQCVEMGTHKTSPSLAFYLKIHKWLCKTKSFQVLPVIIIRESDTQMMCFWPLCFIFQWQVKGTVRLFPQVITSNGSFHSGVTQWLRLSVTPLGTTPQPVARRSTKNLSKQSSCMTIPCTTPCFFTTGLKVPESSLKAVLLPVCKPVKVLIRLKAAEWSGSSLKRLLCRCKRHGSCCVCTKSTDKTDKDFFNWIFCVIKKLIVKVGFILPSVLNY